MSLLEKHRGITLSWGVFARYETLTDLNRYRNEFRFCFKIIYDISLNSVLLENRVSMVEGLCVAV